MLLSSKKGAESDEDGEPFPKFVVKSHFSTSHVYVWARRSESDEDGETFSLVLLERTCALGFCEC